MTTCPHCGRSFNVTPKARKSVDDVMTARAVDTSKLNHAELYAYFKKTAPLEDCRFFARNPGLSPEVHALAAELVYDVQNGLSRPETYKRLRNLQDRWREEKYFQRVIAPAERLKRRLMRANARMPCEVATVNELQYAYR